MMVTETRAMKLIPEIEEEKDDMKILTAGGHFKLAWKMESPYRSTTYLAKILSIFSWKNMDTTEFGE